MSLSKGFCALIGLLILGIASLGFAEIRAGSSEITGYVGGAIGLNETRFEGFPYYDPSLEATVDFSTELKSGVSLGLRAGYNLTPYIGTEVGVGWASNDLKDVLSIDGQEAREEVEASHSLWYSNLVIHLLPKSRFVPFLTGGVGAIYSSMSVEVNGYYVEVSETHFAPNFGGGVKIFLRRDLALRIDVRDFTWKYDDTKDRLHMLEISGGLTWFWGGRIFPY